MGLEWGGWMNCDGGLKGTELGTSGPTLAAYWFGGTPKNVQGAAIWRAKYFAAMKVSGMVF